MDRYRQYKLIEDLAREGGCQLLSSSNYKMLHLFALIADVVFTPPFVELLTTDVAVNLTKLKEAGVKFPFGELFQVTFL